MKFSVDEKALLGDLFVMLVALFCMLFNLVKLFPFVFDPIPISVGWSGNSGFNMILWSMIK